MIEHGFTESSGRLCMQRFKTLFAKYKRFKTLGRGGERWPYFAAFEEMFGDDPTINPPNLLEAGAAYNRVGARRMVKYN